MHTPFPQRLRRLLDSKVLSRRRGLGEGVSFMPLFGYADQLDHVGRSSSKTQRPPMVSSTVTGSAEKVSQASLINSNLTIPL